ncbi:MAG TPA: TolC family protein [Gemmatimonadales bacterium]|nr:TolC family protein [Gemmatimonadales bacterium]
MRSCFAAVLAALVLLTPARIMAQQTKPSDAVRGPLTLLDAVQLGRQRAVSATLAQLSLRAARERVGERRADLLPNIGGIATWTRQTLNLDEFGIPIATGVTDPFSLYRFQLHGSQTLVDASAIERLRAASDSVAAAGLDAQAAGSLAGAAAGLSYLRVLSARETVRARQADSAVAADLLRQVQQMAEAGVVPAIDRTRNEVNFAAVQTQLAVARNQYDRARLDLARLLDLPLDRALTLADSLGMASADLPTDPDSAAAYAVAHRPEVAAEQRRTQVARMNSQAIWNENLPSLELNGMAQSSGQRTDGLAGTWSVQLGVSIPIFDGLRRQKRHAAANIAVAAQELREHDITTQVEAEARQAVLDLESARQQVTLAEHRLSLAQQELDQAQERFRAGVAGSVETTTAQSGLISARDALIQARVNYGTARVSAYRALGMLDQLH